MIHIDFKRLMNSSAGKVFISIILGLGLASLFQKVCKDKECIHFSGPVIKEINGKVFEYDNKCYQYDAKPIKCKTEKRILNFSIKDPFDESATKTTFGSAGFTENK
jgi:hypothetical protein